MVKVISVGRRLQRVNCSSFASIENRRFNSTSVVGETELVDMVKLRDRDPEVILISPQQTTNSRKLLRYLLLQGVMGYGLK